MSKVICDICGTTYQDTADCCPICGCSQDIAKELAREDFVMEETTAESRGKNGRFSSKKREIFDYDEVNTGVPAEEEEDSYPYGGEEEDEDEPQHNTFLVILLTVLIVALLAVTGFLFVKFFLPNMLSDKETTPVTETQAVEETQTETTELRIPCQSLALSSGNAELTHEGNFFLLNVIVTPEDTTDDLVFTSGDESIATVTEDGRITAVSEGSTVIYITCGDQQVTCPVTCSFAEDTEPTVEETAADATGETEAEEATEATANPNVELKLKKSDIRLGVYYEFQLELDCDLKPEDVEWSSEHPYIATVDEYGVVTAIKVGTTAIIAKYGDQEVQCIVRCF